MHASSRRMALASATAIVVLLSSGIAHSVAPGGSLSTPVAPKTQDEEKGEKEAKKAAKKAEEEAEESLKEAASKTEESASQNEADFESAQSPDPSGNGPPESTQEAAVPMRAQEAPDAQTPQDAAAEQVILQVFGPEQGPTAVRVARCESSMATTATNGSYAGLFQMGSHERSTYGHGADPRSQAEAAYSYFSRSGWSPWTASRSCWGG